MSMYREEANKYKSKRIGQTDAKVVAPKGRKKKVHKPWCVTIHWSATPSWGPSTYYFAKEEYARSYVRKYDKWHSVKAVLSFEGKEIPHGQSTT